MTTVLPRLDWREANQAHLETHLDVLRLALRRHARHLRSVWKDDALQPYAGLVVGDAQADRLLAGDDARARDAFLSKDPEALRLAEAIARKEREADAQARAMRDAGTPAALDALCARFGLGPFERSVLLLAAAPELDPAFERVLAYVQDDVNRRHATPHLALALFGGRGRALQEARDALHPDAPLRRHRLVEADAAPGAPWMGARLFVDERIAHHLRGADALDPRVRRVARPVPPLPEAHPDLADRLARWMSRATAPTVVQLLGRPGMGRRALARAAVARLGLALHELDARRLPAEEEARRDLLRLVEREMALADSALFLDLTDVDARDVPARAAADDALASAVPVLIASRERWPGAPPGLAVPVPAPEPRALRRAWTDALGGERDLGARLDAIVQQFDFGPEAIAQAVAAARARAELRAEGAAVTEDDLWRACREQAGARLDDLARRIVPAHGWEDIVLPENVVSQLRELAAQVANRPRVHDEWNFGARLARGRGVSALFAGPSGTGKTMAAEVLAAHLDLDLCRVDLAGVVSKYVGETEKNLRRVFEAAEAAGAILFFDEADALFGKRTDVRDSHDRYANIEVDYLLQRMEDYRGLAILATNRKSDLDRAFLRRLRFVVEFPMPDAQHRRRIWQKAFPREAAVEGLDFDALARLDLSGGHIRNVALNAAFLAAADGTAIGPRHVLHAARREYAKMERPLTESDLGAWARQGGARR